MSPASFHRWRKQLREAGAVPPQAASFIDVSVLPSPASSSMAATADQPQLEVRFQLNPGLALHIVRR